MSSNEYNAYLSWIELSIAFWQVLCYSDEIRTLNCNSTGNSTNFQKFVKLMCVICLLDYLCLSVSSSRERKYERIERYFLFTKSQPMISWYRQPLNPDLPAWNSLIRPPRNRLEFKVVSLAFIVSSWWDKIYRSILIR